jgi:predicted aldo/keto reductase-like oxidoreductase
MEQDFWETTLGKTGLRVRRVGLSATYRPGVKTVHRALDEGINYFFAFGLDGQMFRGLRDVLRTNREKCVVATGAYNLLLGHPNLERTLDKRLRQLKTDYVDVFMYLGVVKEEEFPPRLIDQFQRLKETGKVRFVGLSTHARKFAGRLAAENAADVLMVRYNAAHRGAEEDIFPHLRPYDPGIVSFTATRWRYLVRRPGNRWPADAPVPTPGMAYRFVLSNPAVHVCLMAPTNIRQFESNMKEIREGGPLQPEEMEFMKKFGDAVHHTKTKMFSRDDNRRIANP